jgi:hypothetical protein
MPSHAAPSLRAVTDGQADHSFAPDFARAIVGGFVVLALSALVYTLIVTWGGLRLDLALPVGAAAPLSAFPRELAALFMSGALVVLIARTLTARTG